MRGNRFRSQPISVEAAVLVSSASPAYLCIKLEAGMVKVISTSAKADVRSIVRCGVKTLYDTKKTVGAEFVRVGSYFTEVDLTVLQSGRSQGPLVSPALRPQ